MENIHILPTDKPSRLACDFDKLILNSRLLSPILYKTKNIYITSDEEIKEGDWFIANNGVHKCIRVDNNTSCPFITLNSKGEEIGHFKTWRTKIILTTDQSLDSVQAIDDEFLEWFVKNPSCEWVEVEKGFADGTAWGYNFLDYKIIIPKEESKQIKCYCGHTTYCDCSPLEEPKQETLEEAALRFYPKVITDPYNPSEDLLKEERTIFIEGAKWQQEQILQFLYSEIIERRPYSSSKMCEVVIEFIEQLNTKK